MKKEVREFKGENGIKHFWHYDPAIFQNGPYKVEIDYPEDYVWEGTIDKADMISPSISIPNQYPTNRDTSKDETIPISKRMFTHPQGHLIGYTRAKMLGLI